MSLPRTRFQNNQEAAHAISNHIEPHNFSVRPFNRFLPAFSDWWFVRKGKSNWPASHLPKLFISRLKLDGMSSPNMYTGFYIEKGFGRAVATVSGVPEGCIMDPEWHWDGFIDRLSQNQYEEPGNLRE